MLMRRPLRGVAIAGGFILALMVLLYRAFMVFGSLLDDAAFAWSLGTLVAIWLGALLDLFLETRPLSPAAKTRRDGHFRRGVEFYLKDELDDALKEFRSALKLDRGDIESRLHLAMVYKRMGRTRQARRELKKCLALDHGDKWRREVTDELEAL